MQKTIFSNEKITQEFLDRFSELSEAGLEASASGLESLSMADESLSSVSIDVAAESVRNIQEGVDAPIDPGLEAIILRFGRPAYFVRDNTFSTDNSSSSSNEVDGVVNDAKENIDFAIPRVGRINLRNHRAPWVGTAWVVAPNVVVTNRHVASVFAQQDGDAFVFVESAGRVAKAEMDTRREHQRPEEAVFQLKKVLWIAPPVGSHDVAFLSIEPASIDGDPQPSPISLMENADYDALPVQKWAAIIGYPAFSIHNDSQDQQRIFEGVFSVKRLQPGLITAKGVDGIVKHDATTLGGNSGSVVMDLDTGTAVALHFGGLEGASNSAVAAPVVRELLLNHVMPFV